MGAKWKLHVCFSKQIYVLNGAWNKDHFTGILRNTECLPQKTNINGGSAVLRPNIEYVKFTENPQYQLLCMTRKHGPHPGMKGIFKPIYSNEQMHNYTIYTVQIIQLCSSLYSQYYCYATLMMVIANEIETCWQLIICDSTYRIYMRTFVGVITYV